MTRHSKHRTDRSDRLLRVVSHYLREKKKDTGKVVVKGSRKYEKVGGRGQKK